MVMIHIEKNIIIKVMNVRLRKLITLTKNINELFESEEDISGRKWWLSGYIFLPNSKLELKDDINNIMHGRISYEDKFSEITVLGFDCNHKNDGDEENTIEFVENNLKEVIDFIEGGKENE